MFVYPFAIDNAPIRNQYAKFYFAQYIKCAIKCDSSVFGNILLITCFTVPILCDRIDSKRVWCLKAFFFLFTWSNTSNLNWQNVRISSPFLSSSTFSIYQTSDNLSTMVSLKARLHDAILASMRVRLWHLPCQWFFRVCCFCCLLMKVALNTLAHQCQKVDFLREILRKAFKKRSFYIQVNIDWCDK